MINLLFILWIAHALLQVVVGLLEFLIGLTLLVVCTTIRAFFFAVDAAIAIWKIRPSNKTP